MGGLPAGTGFGFSAKPALPWPNLNSFQKASCGQDGFYWLFAETVRTLLPNIIRLGLATAEEVGGTILCAVRRDGGRLSRTGRQMRRPHPSPELDRFSLIRPSRSIAAGRRKQRVFLRIGPCYGRGER